MTEEEDKSGSYLGQGTSIDATYSMRASVRAPLERRYSADSQCIHLPHTHLTRDTPIRSTLATRDAIATRRICNLHAWVLSYPCRLVLSRRRLAAQRLDFPIAACDCASVFIVAHSLYPTLHPAPIFQPSAIHRSLQLLPVSTPS